MAKQVQAQIAGGEVKVVRNVETVKELRRKLDLDKDHSATVNGEPEADEYELNDYELVTFAPKVQGGF